MVLAILISLVLGADCFTIVVCVGLSRLSVTVNMAVVTEDLEARSLLDQTDIIEVSKSFIHHVDKKFNYASFC